MGFLSKVGRVALGIATGGLSEVVQSDAVKDNFLGGAEKKAAKAQEEASQSAAQLAYRSGQDSLAEARRQFDLSRSDARPWQQAGQTGLRDLMGLYGLGTADQNTASMGRYRNDPLYAGDLNNFEGSPGYQFRVEEGEKGILRNLSRLGLRGSGAAMKALERFRQGTASDEYQNHYNRVNNSFGSYANRLSNVAGVGQTVNSNLASLGANYAGNVGNINANTSGAMGNAYQAGGAARASGYVGRSNAIRGTIGQVAGGLGALAGGGFGFGGSQGAPIPMSGGFNFQPNYGF